MNKQYELLYPPKEIFLNEKFATWDWDSTDLELYKTAEYILPDKGIEFYPKKGLPCFDGFPFPYASENVAIFKKFVLTSARRMIKNPFSSIGFKKHFMEMASVSVKRYSLKPERYARGVREIYRLCGMVLKEGKTTCFICGAGIHEDNQYHNFQKWTEKDLITHAICSIFQWDTAYRYRLMFLASRIRKEAFKKNPVKELKRAVNKVIGLEITDRMRKNIGFIWFLLRILLIIPRFRATFKTVVKEIKLEEFEFSSWDLKYAFQNV